jgi:hypothetical protein
VTFGVVARAHGQCEARGAAGPAFGFGRSRRTGRCRWSVIALALPQVKSVRAGSDRPLDKLLVLNDLTGRGGEI